MLLPEFVVVFPLTSNSPLLIIKPKTVLLSFLFAGIIDVLELSKVTLWFIFTMLLSTVSCESKRDFAPGRY